MNMTLDYLRGSRKWSVPGLAVWGDADSVGIAFLAVEEGVVARVIFGDGVIGGQSQEVKFADLVDVKGNNLPTQIANPVVVLIPRNAAPCFLIGKPSSTGFKIARASGALITPGYGLVDLLIMEVNPT